MNPLPYEPPHPSAVLREKNGLEWFQWRHPTSGILQIELTGKGILPDDETEKLLAEWMTPDHYEILASDEDVDIYKPPPSDALALLGGESTVDPENRLLVVFRKGAIPIEIARAAAPALRSSARPSRNRGNAAGKVDLEKLKMGHPERILLDPSSKVRARYYTLDGDLSKVNIANVTMGGIIGNFSSSPRNPYCRQTAYTRDHFEEFSETLVPLIREVDRCFRETVPGRWTKQRDFIRSREIDRKGWAIADTVFTTGTVNYNFRTAGHYDAGDFVAGFGNITVVERGDRYEGCHTVFPKFRIAANVRTGDFVAMDVHELHGNTDLLPADPEKTEFERLTLVCYCRTALEECGTTLEEEDKYERWAALGSLQERRREELSAEKADNSLGMLLNPDDA